MSFGACHRDVTVNEEFDITNVPTGGRTGDGIVRKAWMVLEVPAHDQDVAGLKDALRNGVRDTPEKRCRSVSLRPSKSEFRMEVEKFSKLRIQLEQT